MKYLLIFLLSLQIHAQYRYVIYTDQESGERANEVISLFQNTVPFNEFEIEYEVRQMPTEELGCTRPYPEVERVIECDTRHIVFSAHEEGFDQAMVISDSELYGGAAGTVPVMSSVNTAETMVHEYLHVLGFCDEYHYTTQEEADLYCSNPRFFDRYINVALIEPLEEGYTSDEHAREEHSGAIPWYANILSTVPIATATLGTPSEKQFTDGLGLFESGVCDNATTPLALWRPGSETNIMGNQFSPIGAYVPLVREALESVIAISEIEIPEVVKGGASSPDCEIEDTLPLSRDNVDFIRSVSAQLDQ